MFIYIYIYICIYVYIYIYVYMYVLLSLINYNIILHFTVMWSCDDINWSLGFPLEKPLFRSSVI